MTDEQLNCLIDIRLDLANHLFFYEDSIKVFKIFNKANKTTEIEKESYETEANKIRKKIEILDLIINEERKNI